MSQQVQLGYADVNGLHMYYEVHGTGEPLVMLHGGMTTIEDFAAVLPSLSASRQVIAFERQGHGHTADIDRPFTMEHWADDTAALLDHLNIDQVDVFGYSTGGSVALAFAMRHPQRLRKLVVVSGIYNAQGYPPEIMEGLKHATAEAMPPIMQEMYASVAPHPENWAKLVAKSVESAATFKGWSAEQMGSIQSPTLVMLGDSDIVLPEHALEMSRIIPGTNLAVLPQTDHIQILFDRAEWVASMTNTFLDAPPPETH